MALVDAYCAKIIKSPKDEEDFRTNSQRVLSNLYVPYRKNYTTFSSYIGMIMDEIAAKNGSVNDVLSAQIVYKKSHTTGAS